VLQCVAVQNHGFVTFVNELNSMDFVLSSKVLQCVAVRCSALQCVVVCCSVSQWIAVCSALQCVAV